MKDDEVLDASFEEHIAALPETKRPRNRVQERRMFNDWEGDLKSELSEWENELEKLESQPIDRKAIFDSARNKVLHLLHREARTAGVLPEEDHAGKGHHNMGDEWCQLTELDLSAISGRKPRGMKVPDGREVSKKTWAEILSSVAEWLVHKGLLTQDLCPIHIGKAKRPLIDTKRINSKNGGNLNQRELSNGLFICVNFNARNSVEMAMKLLERFSKDPSRFSVQLDSIALPK